jgi:hypothetical protein
MYTILLCEFLAFSFAVYFTESFEFLYLFQVSGIMEWGSFWRGVKVSLYIHVTVL